MRKIIALMIFVPCVICHSIFEIGAVVRMEYRALLRILTGYW